MQTSRDMKGNKNHFIDTPVRGISRKRLVYSLRKEQNMMNDTKKTNEDLFFFHLSLYYKVNCNHVAITINIPDKGPDLSLK